MWILYTLLTAFLLASSDAITKDLLHRYSPWQVIRARFLLALIFLAPLPFIYGFPTLDKTFWLAAGADLPLEVLALLLYLKAIAEFEFKKFPASEKSCNQLITDYPKSQWVAKAIFLKAKTFTERNDYEKALTIY